MKIIKYIISYLDFIYKIERKIEILILFNLFKNLVFYKLNIIEINFI